eukprot:1394482-Amorphochlora_amoeboformis.AAC.1
MQQRQEERRKFRQKEEKAALKQKRELIRQIQTMVAQAQAKARVAKTLFDPTTSSGVGSLDEMSLNELQERLVLLKLREMRELKEKRQKINSKRESKREDLTMRQKRLERLRKNKAVYSEKRRAAEHEAAVKREESARTRREKEVVSVHTRLSGARERKRAEALRLARDLETRKVAKTFLEADAAKVEEMRWRQVQRGHARKAERQQAIKVAGAERRRAVQDREKNQRTINLARREREKEKLRRNYDATLKGKKAKAMGIGT